MIVNAANIEATFGGGLSGAIARATKKESLINTEAHEIISMFTTSYLKQHSNDGSITQTSQLSGCCNF